MVPEHLCVICKQGMNLTPYPKGRGYKLDCKGTDTEPHRVRVYVDGFRKDSALLKPVPEKVLPVSPEPRGNRASELLSRVRGLVGKKEGENVGTENQKAA